MLPAASQFDDSEPPPLGWAPDRPETRDGADTGGEPPQGRSAAGWLGDAQRAAQLGRQAAVAQLDAALGPGMRDAYGSLDDTGPGVEGGGPADVEQRHGTPRGSAPEGPEITAPRTAAPRSPLALLLGAASSLNLSMSESTPIAIVWFCGYFMSQHWRGVIEYLAMVALAGWGGSIVANQARRAASRTPAPLLVVMLALLSQLLVFALCHAQTGSFWLVFLQAPIELDRSFLGAETSFS